ncbi:MAG: MarR family transcriptional regulator [Deltaproteobacteria bacterium]|nr:MAG: MarR family transcriptional regulator [Deltaproteobacteria bacterium]
MNINSILCFALYATSRSMGQLYATYLDKYDLTYPQLLILFLLWDKEGQSIKELGSQLFLDTGTLTPLLKRMEKKNLVIRKRNTDDERIVQIFLTPDGNKLQKMIPKMADSMLCDLGMNAEEVAQMAGKIHEIRSNIDNAIQYRL